MPNRLQQSLSLYLRQHANNPIDWFAWGDDALNTAKQLERPLFISIGYSSCHWCHVMETESFTDATIAEFLNQHFVAIKIDREEHPDLDQQYMRCVQLLNNGQGGWPMSIFCLPDGRPFFAGTYFPNVSKHGRIGFLDLLKRIAQLWSTQRQLLVVDAEKIYTAINSQTTITAPTLEAGQETKKLHWLLAESLKEHDRVHGGRLGAPKFAPYDTIKLWLYAQAYLHPLKLEIQSAYRLTLDKLLWSGLRDQLTGGFHRYCVDEAWQVPHFEKMLYDQIAMLTILLEAVRQEHLSDDQLALDMLLDELTTQWCTAGGWFSMAWDADDPHGEGGFYTWTAQELLSTLAQNSHFAIDYYQVETPGPVDGRSTLFPLHPPRLLQEQNQWQETNKILKTIRQTRPAPQRDDKAVISLQGNLLVQLAQVYRQYAENIPKQWHGFAQTLKQWGQQPDLPHVMYDHGQSVGLANLEDYAGLGYGLWRWGIETDQVEFIITATTLGKTMLSKFSHSDGWNSTQVATPLGHRAQWYDRQEGNPAGSCLRWLSEWTALVYDPILESALEALLKTLARPMENQPQATMSLWFTYHRFRAGIGVIKETQTPATYYQKLAPQCSADLLWLRHNVGIWLVPQASPLATPSLAYCRGLQCQPLPENDFTQIQKLLEQEGFWCATTPQT